MPKITTRDDADLLDVTQATAPLDPPRPHIIGPVADLNITRANPFSGDGSPEIHTMSTYSARSGRVAL